MSALHRLKAYFGMIPADELDDYGPDYGPEYGGDYGPDYRDYEDYPPERTLHRSRRSGPEEYDAWGRYRRADDGLHQPDLAAVHAARRPAWPSDSPVAQVRGSLAVDTAPPLREPAPRNPAAEDAHPLSRIVTLHPRTYNEARLIGERYREGTPVIMNLTEMDDADAKRLVDFAAGLAFALRGCIDKVTTKVFLLSPTNVDVSAEDRRRLAEGGLLNHS